MKLILDANKFVQILRQAGAILSKSDISKSVTFTVEGEMLYTTIVTSLVYQGVSDILDGSDIKDTSITVHLLPIMDIFTARGNISLDIDGGVVIITQGAVRCVCGHSEALVSKREFPPMKEAQRINTNKLVAAVGTLAKAAAMKRMLNIERPMSFYGDTASIAYPTMIVSVTSSGIHSTISVEDAKWIASFRPEAVIEDDTIIFYSELGCLQMPRSATTVNNFPVVSKGLINSVTIKTDNLVNRLREINKALPRVDTTLGIYEDGGLTITVSSMTESVNITLNPTKEKQVALLMQAPTEYFILAFSLLGIGTVNINYAKGDRVCLTSLEAQILMSLR